MIKCSCGRPVDVLNDKRLGYCEGLHYLNCPCGSTYSLTSLMFMDAVNQKQKELALVMAKRLEPTPERKALSKRMWALAELIFKGRII